MQQHIGSRGVRTLLSPLRIAVIFVVIAALWIVFSDRLLHAVLPDAEAMAQAQTVKGLVFVLAVGGLIWALTRHLVSQIETVRRAQIAALRDSEERFRATFEQAAVGMAHATLDGCFRRINARLAAMLGRSAEDLAGLGWADVTHPDDIDDLARQIREVAAGRRPQAHVETRYLLPEGGIMWGRTTLSPIYGEDGRVQWLAAVCEDITLRKQMERDLVQTVEELTRSNTELERFAHLASHDLKEPTRILVSFSQLLERRLGETIDSEARTYLGHIIAGARRMRQIVDDLMAYARSDTRQERFRDVDLGRALEAALDSLTDSIDRENALVRVEGALPVVTGLDDQIVQVFRALVGNALKFRHPDRRPQVSIRAEPEGEQWCVEIVDNGVGFDQDRADEAFQVFRRLHGPGVTPGSGIGLALARRIVERHGGTISLTTRRDEGTTVRFCLPVGGSQSARAAE